MAAVHDLDHVKLDLDQPSSSTQKKPLPTPSSRSTASNKTNHKLEYFLTLVCSTKSTSALVKLIEDLLGSDGIYVFGELLDTKPISDLACHPTHASHHQLLEIFAYGTWKEYRARADSLPTLNAAQARKLKLLSVITRASQSRIIPYSELLELLEIRLVHELEELIIDAIYCNLLEARLDQKYSRVEVESCIGRDMRLTNTTKSSGNEDVFMDGAPSTQTNVTPATLADLRTKLDNLCKSTAKVLTQLDNHIELIRQKDRDMLEFETKQQASIDRVIQSGPLLSSDSSRKVSLPLV